MPLILDDAMNSLGSVNGAMDSAMNGTMNVDLEDVDLFGDPVGLQLQARPPPKQLQQRLDELRSRGCCQSIAWSRQGTIASISADGRSVEFRYLHARPEDGSWALSEPTPCSVLSTSLRGGPIVHLAWAATASPELAVIDSVGRIGLLSFSFTLNRPFKLRDWDNDSVDDLHAVVGSYWLPLIPQSKQYNVLHGPAVREEGNIRYESSFIHAFGPYHPNAAKSALLCVTTNGQLKLFYAQNNNRIHDTTLELESINTSDDLITHASMCSEKNTLYMALATSSKQLKIIRTTIQWGTAPSDKAVPAGSMPLNPSLKEKHVAITNLLQHNQSDSHLDAAMSQLSHLEILPSTLDSTGQAWAPPVVLAVRSYIPSADSPYSQEYQSIIDRWEILNDQPQTIHPAFVQLGSRHGGGSSPLTMTRLRKLDSIVLNKVIISMHTIQLGKVICLAFSDGSVQYYDRLTMSPVYNEHNSDRIMSLSQVGFTCGEETPCLQVAFSPTNCSFVQICDDGKIKWNVMRYPDPRHAGSSMQDTQYSSIVAGLTVVTSAAAFQNMHYDDILAVARQFADNPRFAYDWIAEIIRMLKIPVDYSEESHHDQLFRNSHLQLCLSILKHMGFKGEFEPRTFGGKFAMLVLNLRNVVVLITVASNTPVNLKDKLSPLDEPEVVDALAGCAKWTIDLLSWISDCLFCMLKDQKFMSLLNPQHFSQMTAYLRSENDVALHLLLCSSTRGFIAAACRRLMHLDSMSTRAIQYYQNKAARNGGPSKPPTQLYQAYLKMHHYTSTSLINVSHMDKLLQTLGADIRAAYQTSLSSLVSQYGLVNSGAQGSNTMTQQQQQQQQGSDTAIKRAQSQCELSMLMGSNPPPFFLPVLQKLFDTDLKTFRATTDPAKLYFTDFSLLEVEDTPKCLAARRAKGLYVDVFKRVLLTRHRSSSGPGPLSSTMDSSGVIAGGLDGIGGEIDGHEARGVASWRRCVRCAAIMGDVYGSRPGFNFVLTQQRKCACGGSWGLLPKGWLTG